MKHRLPAVFFHLGYMLAALGLILVIGRILDPSIVYRQPIDLQDSAPGYLQELDSAARYTMEIPASDQSEKCPGKDCPLNTDFKNYEHFKKLKQFPMIDEMLAPKAYRGRLFYRLETVVPNFVTSKTDVVYDALGIRGESWRFFVNGQLVSRGLGGALEKSIRLPMSHLTPGQPLVLGFEIVTGEHLAPGIYHTSQQFMASEIVAKLVRETYRSSDYSAIMPVAYAFGAFGLLAALGVFFTPFFYELIFFSSLVAAWTYRHLLSNSVIEVPAFLPQDIVSIDAALKLLLLGSMVGFFNLYFRWRTKYKTLIGIGTIALTLSCYFSSTWGFIGFPLFVLQHQDLFFGIAMAFGCFAATFGYLSARAKPHLVFRKFVTSMFAVVLLISSTAFLVRYVSVQLQIPTAEILVSYAVRQIFSIWVYFVVLGGGVAIALEWALVVFDRQRILQRFGMMVDHKLLDEITGSDQFVSRRCNAVVAMFVDLRSFTKMCDEAPPDEVLNTLNSFLGIITKSIQEYDGIVDKFVGDGVMAFWGVRVATDLDVSSAVQATAAIRRRIAALNIEREKVQQRQLAYGIGIHLGDAIFGAVGSEAYIDYTAIGPAVNIAARVQDMTKAMNATVLITAPAYVKLSDQKLCVSKGKVAIRGVAAELEIFEIDERRQSQVEQDSPRNVA